MILTSPTLIGEDLCGETVEDDNDTVSQSEEEQATETEQFRVRRIVRQRTVRGRYIQYQVEWEDYPDPADFTWEPAQQLREDVPEMVAIFNAARKRKTSRES